MYINNDIIYIYLPEDIHIYICMYLCLHIYMCISIEICVYKYLNLYQSVELKCEQDLQMDANLNCANLN